MRKQVLLITVLLLLLAAGTALAGTETFAPIKATCELPANLIVLKPGNLDLHKEWLSSHKLTEQALLDDWAARGVLLQAWSSKGDVCFEITAVRDTYAQSYYDIDEQTPGTRAAYRKGHLSDEFYGQDGYRCQSAEWKKTKQGRFLMLRYKRTVGSETYRGYARRTIKNGYTITLDYKVYGRGLQTADNTVLNKIWNSWVFTGSNSPNGPFPSGYQLLGIEPVEGNVATASDVDEIEDVSSDEGIAAVPTAAPKAPTANIVFEEKPPVETNTGKFKVSGTCDPGINLVLVCMRMSGSEPTRVTATSTPRGKFSMSVQLPEEGIWLMTLNADRNGATTDELVFETVNYQANLLTVNLDEELPSEFTLNGDQLVISGTTMKQTTVQCLVDGKYDKQIRTNNSGKFKFTIDTSAEGTYQITLVFSKKNYSTRRFTSTATRSLTDEDYRERALTSAVKPAYTTISKKIDTYIGKVVTYQGWVTDVQHAGDQWIVFMALRSNKSGYHDTIVVTCEEEPSLLKDEQYRMYGTCVGTYQVQDSVNGDAYYPCFDLIFWGDGK